MGFVSRLADGGFLSGLLLLLATLVLLIIAIVTPDSQVRGVLWFLIGIFGFTATSVLADVRERGPASTTMRRT